MYESGKNGNSTKSCQLTPTKTGVFIRRTVPPSIFVVETFRSTYLHFDV
jgi:hypothetical protein